MFSRLHTYNMCFQSLMAAAKSCRIYKLCGYFFSDLQPAESTSNKETGSEEYDAKQTTTTTTTTTTRSSTCSTTSTTLFYLKKGEIA